MCECNVLIFLLVFVLFLWLFARANTQFLSCMKSVNLHVFTVVPMVAVVTTTSMKVEVQRILSVMLVPFVDLKRAEVITVCKSVCFNNTAIILIATIMYSCNCNLGERTL